MAYIKDLTPIAPISGDKIPIARDGGTAAVAVTVGEIVTLATTLVDTSTATKYKLIITDGVLIMEEIA